jgi:hypothetical protein
MTKQRTITEEIEAAKTSAEQRPEWMKRAAYFAEPRIVPRGGDYREPTTDAGGEG